MRTLLASASLLLLVAAPATAESGRGYLTSMDRATFLCAGEGGFALQTCRATARRLRFYVIERADGHVDFEIQLAATGACLTVEGEPAPGARVTTAACTRQLWRYDTERFRLTFEGLCLSAEESGPILATCGDAPSPRRLEWAIAMDR